MIIEDGTGAELGLPQSYGVDDLPLILQDRLFTEAGELNFTHFARERILGTRGDKLVVNGAISPTARVPAALVRLRLLNAANARSFHLGFDDGRAFQVIASDGGYLSAPVPMQALTVAPGERFEIVVDFSDGRDAVLATTGDPPDDMPRTPGMGSLTSRDPSGAAKSGPGALVTFRVDPSLAAPRSRLPAGLVPIAAPDVGRAVERRTVTLDMWPGMGGAVGAAGGEVGMGRLMTAPGTGPAMGMNGRRYDKHRIDFTPKLGSAEIWEVRPFLMQHPFHVHGAFFRVLSIGGAPPPDHLAAEKDTVLLGQPAEILLRFNQPATEAHPFMVHCHILDHEDGGLMGQYMTT
jgi:FtsP/CotA-like multicopper oxidase with cupredoxin domain